MGCLSFQSDRLLQPGWHCRGHAREAHGSHQPDPRLQPGTASLPGESPPQPSHLRALCVCCSSNSCLLLVWNINTSLCELLCGPVCTPDCGGSSHKMRCLIPTRDAQASTHFPFSLRLLQTQSKDGQGKQFCWLEASIILPSGSLVTDAKENKSSQYLTIGGFHPCEFRSWMKLTVWLMTCTRTVWTRLSKLHSKGKMTLASCFSRGPNQGL